MPQTLTLADRQRLGRYLAILMVRGWIPPGFYGFAPLVKVTT